RADSAPSPRRSAPRLLTGAPRGGLRPPPAGRPRRATKPAIDPAPSSLVQHCIRRTLLLLSSSFRVRGTQSSAYLISTGEPFMARWSAPYRAAAAVSIPCRGDVKKQRACPPALRSSLLGAGQPAVLDHASL